MFFGSPVRVVMSFLIVAVLVVVSYLVLLPSGFFDDREFVPATWEEWGLPGPPPEPCQPSTTGLRTPQPGTKSNASNPNPVSVRRRDGLAIGCGWRIRHNHLIRRTFVWPCRCSSHAPRPGRKSPRSRGASGLT